jgi:hypothetical protein
MNKLICDSMDSWLARRPVTLPVWTGPNERIHGALRRAFRVQEKNWMGSILLRANCKRLETTNYYVLQDPATWRVLYF